MLVLASKLDSDNGELRRVIAGVGGVSVRSHRIPAARMYDPADLGALKQEYHAAGWKQLVNNHEKDGGPGVTDIWFRLENNAVSDGAILVARSNEVNFIVVLTSSGTGFIT